MTPLVQSLCARFPHAQERGDHVRLVLASSDDAPVRVGLTIGDDAAYGAAAVVLHADLGPVSRVEPLAALAMNRHLAFGALAVDGEVPPTDVRAGHLAGR